MKSLIQRVSSASVTVGAETAGQIGEGLLVFLGYEKGDSLETARKSIDKIIRMRIFEDNAGKLNLDITQHGGSLLLVSQFTLYADCRKGNRPSFTRAGKPDHASALYEYMLAECAKELGEDRVQRGIFGADMKLSLLNDGPFTIILDSDELAGPRR